MKYRISTLKTFVAMLSILTLTALPIYAAETEVSSYDTVTPRFNNISAAMLAIGFNSDNVVFCSISVEPYSHCSGISGIMKLFDSSGACLAVWSVSDYDGLIGVEFSHQGVYGETYTVTFEGYAYSNNGAAPDRLEISSTDTCK